VVVCLGHHAIASTSPLFPSSTFPCQSPHLYQSEMGIKNRTKPSLGFNLGIKVDKYGYQKIKYINIIYNHDSQIYLNFVSSFMKAGNSLILKKIPKIENSLNSFFFFFLKIPRPNDF